jgi:hypothetical protein
MTVEQWNPIFRSGDVRRKGQVVHLVLIFTVNITVNIQWKRVRLGTDISVNFYMFHLTCINQVHNIQITNKMHFTVYDLFKSHFSHQHVLDAIVANFRVKLLQEYKGCVITP